MDFVCDLYISLGQNRSCICQQSNSKDIEPRDGSDPGDIGSCGYGIFDDRIEFFNPGKLYGGITIQDLLSGNYTSQCRNKLIANACKEAGLIERYGSGIQRILNICKNYGVVPPVFEEIFNDASVKVSHLTKVHFSSTECQKHRQSKAYNKVKEYK